MPSVSAHRWLDLGEHDDTPERRLRADRGKTGSGSRNASGPPQWCHRRSEVWVGASLLTWAETPARYRVRQEARCTWSPGTVNLCFSTSAARGYGAPRCLRPRVGRAALRVRHSPTRCGNCTPGARRRCSRCRRHAEPSWVERDAARAAPDGVSQPGEESSDSAPFSGGAALAGEDSGAKLGQALPLLLVLCAEHIEQCQLRLGLRSHHPL